MESVTDGKTRMEKRVPWKNQNRKRLMGKTGIEKETDGKKLEWKNWEGKREIMEKP